MKQIMLFLAVLLMVACEKPITGDGSGLDGNLTLTFRTGATRSGGADWFTKLNVMLFREDGTRAFDKVKTQTASDGDFGSMSLQIAEGRYVVVAVGHSSINSATIKSPAVVQFTASDGQKLTDTFSCCDTVVVTSEPQTHSLTMQRVTAMFCMQITDSVMPSSVARMKFDYTGGSANYNPTTLQGITKSTQSETRTADGNRYQCFTFPYLSDTGTLKMTVSAIDAQGVVLCQRTFDKVHVTRNRITTYTGHFFEDGVGEMTQSTFGFSVNGDWDGEDTYTF